MLKEKFKKSLIWLREGFKQVITNYPVEMLLALYFCVGCLVEYQIDSDKFMRELALAPLFFILALVVNILTNKKWIYWVVWLPIIPLSLWSGLEGWYESSSAIITFVILAPLAVFMCRRAVQNERFVKDTIGWLSSAVLALLFANVALGLFAAIFYSTTYIFGLEGDWIEHTWFYVMIITETFVVPTLFLMMINRREEWDFHTSRILDIILNYIVAPAVLIYTAILYLYMIKILVTWSLPEGGVAYLVFGFTIFALIAKALQFLLEKRIYDWFFERFSLISLPTQLLFWIGVARRVSEYGLTEPRVYLIICGGLMTFCVLMFLSKRTGRYLYVCAAGFVVFAVVAYIPSLDPERLALNSQAARLERVARSLDRLDEQGHLILTPVPLSDTVRLKEYRKLYEALDYIYRDSTLCARFGGVRPYKFVDIFPEQMRQFVRWGYKYGVEIGSKNYFYLNMPKNARFEVDNNYPHYYTNVSFNILSDTLRLSLGENQMVVHQVALKELLQRQLEKSGFDPAKGEEPTRGQLMQLLDYRDDKCRIFFNAIDLNRTDSATVINNVRLNAVMLR